MRSGHALALQTVKPSQPEKLSKQEEHPFCQLPCFSRHKWAENDYEHPQCQAEGVSKDVNAKVGVSGPLDLEDKTKVRIRYNYLKHKIKKTNGSETPKWLYLWNTMQAGSHAANTDQTIFGFPLKTDRTTIIQGKQVHYLVSSEEGRKT